MLDIRRQVKYRGRIIRNEDEMGSQDRLPIPKSSHRFSRNFTDKEIVQGCVGNVEDTDDDDDDDDDDDADNNNDVQGKSLISSIVAHQLLLLLFYSLLLSYSFAQEREVQPISSCS